ncbi:MAG: class I peptide chain release factor [Candidatus Marinimicrobia bacterium]|nr:class I peptide chain release factor [Candidatus Neomarinimicrobiota bacterium]
MIHIYKKIFINDLKIRYKGIRSSKPGGQNVNKVSTGIRLKYDLTIHSYPDWFIQNIKRNGKNYISETGILNIKSITHRTQERNKKEALRRMIDLFKKSVMLKKKRIRTRPPLIAKKERMNMKIKRSQKKILRKNPDLYEESF